ncbi:hypothetical protein M3194_14005 [Paenibacillus glycanilyticus]|uniref:hypothetical protein n=1 Tax=Paenibacillus glycanilyticus TaxID=126569 RepID=UPI00203D8425|nr:hypothetical protein [Paenibacillus glycanilyticus]MCM3628476.1 hypothetical protein [Paenibacillus glycanilyticus]
MKLKSELLSSVLKILLGVLVGVAFVDCASSVVYALSYEAFTDYVYGIYGIVEIVSTILYYIVIIIYLIWIYLVHKDLNALFPSFARSPGQALVCMLIPVYNLYGIPSIYRRIGRCYLEETKGAKKEGRWLCSLAAPLLLFMLTSNGLNNVVNRAEVLSESLFVILSLATLILYMIFLVICIQVSRGLRTAGLEISFSPSPDTVAEGFEAHSNGQPAVTEQL